MELDALRDFSLKGHRALVTGSSRGIGREAALTLAALGADVAVHCASQTDSAQSVAESIEKMGRKSMVVKCDLARADSGNILFDRVSDGLGEIDILVLNASMQIVKPWLEITGEDYDRQMNVNLRASLTAVQRFAPPMMRMGWGRIVTVGSVQEFKPHPNMLVYSMTKAAQTMMVSSLAAQLAPYGITVNNLAPGVIDTDRNRNLANDPEYLKKVLSLIPSGRIGLTRECAGALALLCSDAGSYITGTTIRVDGGKAL